MVVPGRCELDERGVVATCVAQTACEPLDLRADCTDGNENDGDGCSADGKVEAGWNCVDTDPTDDSDILTCSTVQGDGIVAGNEACDDGNADDGDGCSLLGAIEAGWACDNMSGTSVCDGIRGDGVVLGTEECDDVDPSTDVTPVDGDGCSAAGEIEPGFECDNAAVPSVCTAIACAENEYVMDNVCTPCQPGATHAAGADASGADTACDADTCLENQYVMDNAVWHVPKALRDSR